MIICARDPNALGDPFLISENETVSSKEFTNAILKGLGTSLLHFPLPVALMRLAGGILGNQECLNNYWVTFR